MISPGEFALMLNEAAIKIEAELVVPTETLMLEVAEVARAAIGTYDFGWQQLSDVTKADRVRLGYTENDPLKRTGQLQESVVGEAEPTPYGAKGVVGSDDPIAIFHEFGTSRMPPRAVFSTAMMLAEESATKIFGEFVMKTLSFRP
jgi:hypothetical protein